MGLEAERERLEKLQTVTPDKVATRAAALLCDDARHVAGQVFGVRNNEIFLFRQHRPFRSAHTAEGWTTRAVRDRVFPSFESDCYQLDRSADVFRLDPF